MTDAKTLIPVKEEALRVAYRNQVDAETKLGDAETNRDNTFEDILEAARFAGRDDLVDAYNKYALEADEAKNEVKEAKKQTELAKADFSLTVLLAAEGRKGRGTHEHVNVVSDTEIDFPYNDPIKMGRVVEWLLSQQEHEPKVLDMLTIKTTPISFFQKAAENGTLPKMYGNPLPLITVREATTTRIDSFDKWLVD